MDAKQIRKRLLKVYKDPSTSLTTEYNLIVQLKRGFANVDGRPKENQHQNL